MLEFLAQLFSTGELVVPAAEDLTGVEDFLTQVELIWRNQLPGVAPAFDAKVAMSAARVVLLFAQAIIDRSIEVIAVQERLAKIGLTAADHASTIYSADLLLRFLPQLAERAARISGTDELLKVFTDVGRAWPLSSVGMRNCGPVRLPDSLNNPTLWRVYVDRVLQAGDKDRMADAKVRLAVEAACGPFSEFAQHVPPRPETPAD